jgi:RHS repeat-associated protein
MDYDEFGKVIYDTNPGFQPFGFASGLYDGETKLVRFGARDYDAQTGRWTTKEPAGFAGSVNFYTYAHNDPVNFVDQSGLADRSSPWQVGWEWLTGTGPRMRVFENGDPFTELLKQHSHMQSVRNQARSQLENCDVTPGEAPYQLSGFQGVPKYFRDYSTLVTGGLTGNLAVTYLGSYDLNYSLTDINWTTGTATINFGVTNTSSFASATRPPVLGYTDFWQKYVSGPLNNLFAGGPMSAKEQQFNWSETINFSARNCGCQ